MFTDFKSDAPIFDAIRIVGGKFDSRDVLAIHGAIAQARALKDDKPIFDVARRLDDDADGLSQVEVDTLNAGLAAARAGAVNIAPIATGRQIGAAGLALIKEFEGLELKAYLCPAKVWTIGYGSTGPHVTPGQVITEAQADTLLQRDLDRFEDAVAKAAPGATQNQFDAMVCLAFNIGIGAFLKSSVLRLHKAGEHRAAAEAFGMWIKGGGRVLPGLQRRRAKEADLYRKLA
ncbi:lysozyme [Novosphingobium sp.]|uniref:lysozyme n=1 Tax=Novosphingobium sp. TaxID=1874826 RepID=UPI00286DE4B7|nr:lysozyme [Novosphingobium sp.]